MEIKGSESELDQADSFLTRFKNILKKHWGILILIGYFFYCAHVTYFEEGLNIESQKVNNDEYSLIKEEYFIDSIGERIGDTVYVDNYSDGVIEKYYIDGEEYR